MLKHYVVFLFPNDPTKIEEFMEVKSCTQEIAKRDLTTISVPTNAYAFYFFDRFEEFINGEYVIGTKINVSIIFYCGISYTFEKLLSEFPEDANYLKPIFENKTFGISHALRTCYNSWILLRTDDIVIQI